MCTPTFGPVFVFATFFFDEFFSVNRSTSKVGCFQQSMHSHGWQEEEEEEGEVFVSPFDLYCCHSQRVGCPWATSYRVDAVTREV
jgi:hypothetical protein